MSAGTERRRCTWHRAASSTRRTVSGDRCSPAPPALGRPEAPYASNLVSISCRLTFQFNHIGTNFFKAWGSGWRDPTLFGLRHVARVAETVRSPSCAFTTHTKNEGGLENLTGETVSAGVAVQADRVRFKPTWKLTMHVRFKLTAACAARLCLRSKDLAMKPRVQAGCPCPSSALDLLGGHR